MTNVRDDTQTHRRRATTLLVAAALVAAGFGFTGGGRASASGGSAYAPTIDPNDFTTVIDNPYLPLLAGSRWVYESRTSEGLEQIVVEVTDETRDVMGVTAVVVRDTVTLDGETIEDTFDWFAQDLEGNVWYFGEDTREFENGVAVNAKGAWEAGIDGAQPGIAMPAEPRVGDRYRQEHDPGNAEDKATVLSLDAAVRVPAGEFDAVLKTRDFTPLDPGHVEHKFYAPGIGLVQEKLVERGSPRTVLVEHTTR